MNKTIIFASIGALVLLGVLFFLQNAPVVTEVPKSPVENNPVISEEQTDTLLGDPKPGAIDVLTSALQANSWVWKETQMSDDTIIEPKEAGSFTLTFDAEGRVSGQTDCNGFGGNYTVTDEVLRMGPFMMTMMYCEGSQEMEFQGMLDEPVTFMFTDAGELVLMLPMDSGSVIFTPNL